MKFSGRVFLKSRSFDRVDVTKDVRQFGVEVASICGSSTVRPIRQKPTSLGYGIEDSVQNVRWRFVSLRWDSRRWNVLYGASHCVVYTNLCSEYWRWKANQWIRDSDLSSLWGLGKLKPVIST